MNPKILIGLLVVGLVCGCTETRYATDEEVLKWMEVNHPNADIVGYDGFGYTVHFSENMTMRKFMFRTNGKITETEGIIKRKTIGYWYEQDEPS
jgi:hypothetical protein